MLVEQLDGGEMDLIRPLLVDLYLSEQEHFREHPQLSREELERVQERIPARFWGENVIFAVRSGDGLAGFCWCVLFDPGTGLEGEVAELYVNPAARGAGVSNRLLAEAMELFRSRNVTFACVWTRNDNPAAMAAYRRAGFRPTEQTVLTWLPL